ncbi:cupin domain-containing protein [Streptosporangium sandarakinum]|uniref:cupin domain-containing protein n=1 Tax=Streptosporangium sandarakinum TaxID=1260955 RepID=UPI003717E104
MTEPPRATPRAVRLRDVPANRRRGGDIRVVLGPKTAGATTGFLGVLTLLGGEHVSEHYHPYSEEFLYVVRGAVTVRVDGADTPVATGEGLLVPIGARHRVTNLAAEPAEVVFHLCPLAPEPSLGHVDTEELPHPEAPHPEIARV